jgi:hypothetical protein
MLLLVQRMLELEVPLSRLHEGALLGKEEQIAQELDQEGVDINLLSEVISIFPDSYHLLRCHRMAPPAFITRVRRINRR